jgi:hypothetical protein
MAFPLDFRLSNEGFKSPARLSAIYIRTFLRKKLRKKLGGGENMVLKRFF